MAGRPLCLEFVVLPIRYAGNLVLPSSPTQGLFDRALLMHSPVPPSHRARKSLLRMHNQDVNLSLLVLIPHHAVAPSSGSSGSGCGNRTLISPLVPGPWLVPVFEPWEKNGSGAPGEQLPPARQPVSRLARFPSPRSRQPDPGPWRFGDLDPLPQQGTFHASPGYTQTDSKRASRYLTTGVSKLAAAYPSSGSHLPISRSTIKKEKIALSTCEVRTAHGPWPFHLNMLMPDRATRMGSTRRAGHPDRKGKEPPRGALAEPAGRDGQKWYQARVGGGLQGEGFRADSHGASTQAASGRLGGRVCVRADDIPPCCAIP